MSHAGYHGNPAAGYRPGHRFLVEAPQILCGSAAPGYDQHVRVRVLIRGPDPRGDLRGRLFPLNGGGNQDDGYRRIPHSGYVQNIMPCRPAGGCNHRHLPGHKGKHSFPCRVEKPFRAEPSFQFLEPQIQVPDPVRPQAHGVQLVRSVLRINVHVSGDAYGIPVRRLHPRPRRVLSEHDAADGGFRVLQGKIPVSRGQMMPESAYFAADGDASYTRFSPDGLGDDQIQLGYGHPACFTHVQVSFRLRLRYWKAAWQWSFCPRPPEQG